MDRHGKHRAKRIGLVYCTLTLIFLIPILLSWYLYYQKDTLGEKTLNYGKLIQPPFPIATFHIYNQKGQLLQNQFNPQKLAQTIPTTNRKWLLLLLAPANCPQNCQRTLYMMRQLRLATGAQMNRIERAVLTFHQAKNEPKLNQLLKNRYPGTQYLYTSKKTFDQIIQQRVKQPYATTMGTVYLVDPLGNIVLSYHPKTNPMHMFKDIERLLKVSQIG